MSTLTPQTLRTTSPVIWPERREIPCRDLDLDCFAFDGQVPFGEYTRCQAYAPELGRCIFLSENTGKR
ncbi:MAG: hypothetical protein Kow0074_14190 [Candidatus Zixiibacteriota bacterium]